MHMIAQEMVIYSSDKVSTPECGPHALDLNFSGGLVVVTQSHTGA